MKGEIITIFFLGILFFSVIFWLFNKISGWWVVRSIVAANSYRQRQSHYVFFLTKRMRSLNSSFRLGYNRAAIVAGEYCFVEGCEDGKYFHLDKAVMDVNPAVLSRFLIAVLAEMKDQPDLYEKNVEILARELVGRSASYREEFLFGGDNQYIRDDLLNEVRNMLGENESIPPCAE